ARPAPLRASGEEPERSVTRPPPITRRTSLERPKRMARRLESDKILFGTVVILVLFGALMVFSASAVPAAERYGTSYYFLLRQLAWAAVGLVAMFGMMNLDYRRLGNPRLLFPAVGLQMLLLAAVLFSPARNHAHRWLHVGPAGFEPSELAKVILVVFLAYFLELRK